MVLTRDYCRVSCFLQPFDKFGKITVVHTYPIRNIKRARTRAIALPRVIFDCVIGAQFKILKTHGCRGCSYIFHIFCGYDFRKIVQRCFLRSFIVPILYHIFLPLSIVCGKVVVVYPQTTMSPKGRQRTTRSVASKRWQGREPTCTTGRLSPERP